FQGDNLEGWLRGILRHRVIDAMRGEIRRACESLGSGVPGTSTSPTGNAAKSERAEKVRNALEQLPPRERDVIELSYFFDWTQREIAEHLGYTRPTVAGLHARGISRLRGLLEKRPE